MCTRPVLHLRIHILLSVRGRLLRRRKWGDVRHRRSHRAAAMREAAEQTALARDLSLKRRYVCTRVQHSKSAWCRPSEPSRDGAPDRFATRRTPAGARPDQARASQCLGPVWVKSATGTFVRFLGTDEIATAIARCAGCLADSAVIGERIDSGEGRAIHYGGGTIFFEH